MKKTIALALVAFALLGAGASADSGSTIIAGWTWDEDSGSTIIAGPSDGAEI